MITTTTTIITTITTIRICRRPSLRARAGSILTEKGHVDPASSIS
jgi:hypothetical protein